jgi:hypothetical protein
MMVRFLKYGLEVRMIRVVIGYFIEKSPFFGFFFIFAKNYGVKNVEKYADRFSSPGRNPGSGR